MGSSPCPASAQNFPTRRAPKPPAADPATSGRHGKLIAGAANREHRKSPPDGDTFDIHRKAPAHLSFGVGVHYCIGASLAQMEGRVALDEILNRFPEWDIDMSRARMVTTSTVRGWESLPAFVR